MTRSLRSMSAFMMESSVKGRPMDDPISLEDGSVDHGGLQTSSKKHFPLEDESISPVLVTLTKLRGFSDLQVM
jgi:hypothetical protein